MANDGTTVVVGGTRAIGLEICRYFVLRGDPVVLTGKDPANVEAAVSELRGLAAGPVDGVTFDLAEPEAIGPALASVGTVRHLVLAAIDRDANSIRDYDIGRAIRLATLKLVGYAEVIHVLLDRMPESASLVLFGGLAKERPYPGSTTVSSVNGGVVGLTRSLVEELRPRRVNSLHPGIVGDSPYWATKPEAIERAIASTPTSRLATMADVVGATVFLLENGAMNGTELFVDAGAHCR
jgi:NAD(P)-dependent dehydrogenase (short-subunit alcohol dehydrogenase family)